MKVCRICMEYERVAATAVSGDEWLAPCRCSGTLKWVHRKCLEESMKSDYDGESELNNFTRKLICSVCQGLYYRQCTLKPVDERRFPFGLLSLVIFLKSPRALLLKSLLLLCRLFSDLWLWTRMCRAAFGVLHSEEESVGWKIGAFFLLWSLIAGLLYLSYIQPLISVVNNVWLYWDLLRWILREERYTWTYASAEREETAGVRKRRHSV